MCVREMSLYGSYLREMCDTEQAKRYDAFVVTSIPKAAVTKVSFSVSQLDGGYR
jgi:hypothetical protein